MAVDVLEPLVSPEASFPAARAAFVAKSDSLCTTPAMGKVRPLIVTSIPATSLLPKRLNAVCASNTTRSAM